MKETIFLKGEGLKNIESYDFSALKKVLKIDRNKLVKEIKNSGLKGRGGAGFPTGLKWEIALNKNADNKYFICNADEGEPGTFKDRYLLENRPLKVLEGILIGAYAVGANEGYIYIRGEYANPISIFKKIIKDARKLRVLGEDIFNSGFNFDLHLVKGAGAYVCGDETSLINSIEGERGRSRLTPPYPIDNGLFGKPTVVNNVETLAACAEIIEQGSEKYASLGTDKSKGTKLICLSGDVNEPGVYELEFGSLTLKEIIYDLGKGVKDNKEIKFIVPGGISTAVLSKDELDISYSYEDIESAGSSLGSGAIIVISEAHDLFDIMANVSKFYVDETCGTCFSCREGNKQLFHILKKADKTGGLKDIDLEIINDLGKTISLSARCGLGQTSASLITSVISKFKDELMVRGDKRC